MKNIAIMGTGSVGQTLASKLISLGYNVMMGTRNVSDKLGSKSKEGFRISPFNEWYEANKGVKLGTFEEASAFGEFIINATQGAHSIDALKLADEKNLNGKIIMDIANPLDFSRGMPPCLVPELSNNNSLGEEIQKTFPQAKVVKTLNTMSCVLMVNPTLIGGGEHTNFICGNDADAKTKVKYLMNEFGWKNENILDLGNITSARGTEATLAIWLRIWGAKQSTAFNFKIVS